MRDHPDERPSSKEDTLMRDHPDTSRNPQSVMHTVIRKGNWGHIIKCRISSNSSHATYYFQGCRQVARCMSGIAGEKE